MNPIVNEPQGGARPRVLPIGIRARQFLLIALVLLPMIFLLAWTNHQRYESLRENELRTEEKVAQGTANTFATHVRGIRQHLFATGQAMLRLSPYTPAQATELLTATATHFPTIHQLSWANPAGKILFSSQPKAVGRTIGASPYFQEIVAGKPWVISDLFQGSLQGDPFFAIAVPVEDENGDLRGVLVAGIGPEEVGAMTIPQDRRAGAAAIFDAQGVIVHFSPAASLSWEDRLLWRESDPLLRQALATGQVQTGLMTPAMLNGEW
ncbi:MAG: cache domain-containing protein, partial [Desulfuromonadales bacterium]|nr:cache domain-containing protein [Desulfuromonadales bacterium]